MPRITFLSCLPRSRNGLPRHVHNLLRALRSLDELRLDLIKARLVEPILETGLGRRVDAAHRFRGETALLHVGRPIHSLLREFRAALDDRLESVHFHRDVGHDPLPL